jgi:hypothetical protein
LVAQDTKQYVARSAVPFDGIGELDVKLDHDGKCEVIKVDDEWLKRE